MKDKTYILTSLVAEGLSFEISAPNEQLARTRLAEAMAEAHDDRDLESWRAELLDRGMWLAIDKTYIIIV